MLDLSNVRQKHLKTAAGNAVSDASQSEEVSAKKTLNEKCHHSSTLSEVDVPQAV